MGRESWLGFLSKYLDGASSDIQAICIENKNCNLLIIVTFEYINDLSLNNHHQMNQSTTKKGKELIGALQKDVYSRITALQSHQLSQLNQRQQMLSRERMRQQKIQQKSSKQIVTHPNNNAHWVSLAGFINDTHVNLDQIEQRMAQRRQKRQELQASKRKEDISEATSQSWGQRQHQKTATMQKIPWKLMRQLRQKEVQENRARLQRIQQNKRQKMGKYHKY